MLTKKIWFVIGSAILSGYFLLKPAASLSSTSLPGVSVITGSSPEAEQYPTQAQQLQSAQADELAALSAKTATTNSQLAAQTAEDTANTNANAVITSSNIQANATVSAAALKSVGGLLGGII